MVTITTLTCRYSTYSTTYINLTRGTGIDIHCGKYTAGWGGTYQIGRFLQNVDHNNEREQGLELGKNGQSIPEVYFDTHWNDNSITYSGKTIPAYMYEMTGRTVFLRLNDKPDYPGP